MSAYSDMLIVVELKGRVNTPNPKLFQEDPYFCECIMVEPNGSLWQEGRLVSVLLSFTPNTEQLRLGTIFRAIRARFHPDDPPPMDQRIKGLVQDIEILGNTQYTRLGTQDLDGGHTRPPNPLLPEDPRDTENCGPTKVFLSRIERLKRQRREESDRALPPSKRAKLTANDSDTLTFELAQCAFAIVPFLSIEEFRRLRLVSWDLTNACMELESLERLANVGRLLTLTDPVTVNGPVAVRATLFRTLTVIAQDHNTEYIQRLALESLPQLTSIDFIATLSALKRLTLYDIPDLTSIGCIGTLSALESLTLRKLPRLTSIDSIGTLGALKNLTLWDLPLLASINCIGTLSALESYTIAASVMIRG